MFKNKKNSADEMLNIFMRYRFLLSQLVGKEFKIKYNHIVKCIKAWKKSLENASDAIKKDIEIKEQEVIEKIHQESVPKFGLG